jgi:hypothetical protein
LRIKKFIAVNFLMDKWKEEAYIHILMEVVIKVNGKIMKKMDKEQ